MNRVRLLVSRLAGGRHFPGRRPRPTRAEGPPLTYEVVINGETFRVEGNRRVKLESKEHPGTSYDVAVRVSPTQHRRLDSVELDY